MKFSPEKLEKVQEIINRYPAGKQKSALIPLLHLAQEEAGGWLDTPAMDYVAELLGITPIEVYEVAVDDYLHRATIAALKKEEAADA